MFTWCSGVVSKNDYTSCVDYFAWGWLIHSICLTYKDKTCFKMKSLGYLNQNWTDELLYNEENDRIQQIWSTNSKKLIQYKMKCQSQYLYGSEFSLYLLYLKTVLFYMLLLQVVRNLSAWCWRPGGGGRTVGDCLKGWEAGFL